MYPSARSMVETNGQRRSPDKYNPIRGRHGPVKHREETHSTTGNVLGRDTSNDTPSPSQEQQGTHNRQL